MLVPLLQFIYLCFIFTKWSVWRYLC